MKKVPGWKKIEIVCVIIVVAFMSFLIGIYYQSRTERGSIRSLCSGWYQMKDGKRIELELPCSVTADAEGKVILYNDTLTEDDRGLIVSTRGIQDNLEIRTGERILYHYADNQFQKNKQMKGKMWADVRLPEEMGQEPLCFIYEGTAGRSLDIQVPILGSFSAIIVRHLQASAFSILMIISMLGLGIVAVSIFLYTRHRQLVEKRFVNVAVFLIICSLWCILDSGIYQMYGKHSAAGSLVSFYAFMLMSVPMVHFVKNTLKFEKYKVLDVINLLFYANALIQGILNKCLKIHMVHMLFVTHVLLFIAVITIVVLMIEEYRRTKDSELKIIMNAFGIMAVAGVLSLCMYWKLEIPFYGTIFEVGVLIFEQLLLTSIFVNLVEQAKTRSELEVYERLLKEDRMTGINNRTAFEEQLQDIEDHAQDYDNAALIFMDVDGLKNTNDLYGHNAGDELIISAALCIKNVFATYGKCYRIGGDEFCVLIFDSIENMDELLKQMDQEIIKYNRNNRYYLSITRGVSFLKDTEGKQKKISDWKYEADQDMYCNKKRRNINDRL